MAKAEVITIMLQYIQKWQILFGLQKFNANIMLERWSNEPFL